MNYQHMFRTIKKKVLNPLAWKLSVRELSRLINNGNDIETSIKTMREYVGRGFYARINASQHNREIQELCQYVQKLSPKTIVEIGTRKGGTLFLWCRTNPNTRLIISIDLPGGNFGDGYNERRTKLYHEFVTDRPNTALHLLRENSHDIKTREKLEAILSGNKIDFLFIDGDHTYTGVKSDFELYSPLVRKGGIIAFHDIVTYSGGHEVYKFWDEIKKEYHHQELIYHPQKWMGIGILHIK